MRQVYSTGRPRQQESTGQTRFKSQQFAAVVAIGTPASSGYAEDAQQAQPSMQSEAQDARAYFLAKRYMGESTLEDDARYHMLTERLRRLHPRVTAADIAQLDSDVTFLEGNAEFMAELELNI